VSNEVTAAEPEEAAEGSVDSLENALVVAREDHPISRSNICPFALKVLYRLHRSNYTAYLVGGGVRDLLLGREPKDFDVSTDARPGQIKRLFRNCWLIGRRFRLAHIKYGQTIIETSTFRTNPEAVVGEEDGEGGEKPDLYVRDDNVFGSPEEDAFRRDFTINGLFYDIGTFSVIDYVGGLADLKKKLVRCIGDPNIRFREDPVRMLRAVRFAARLGFKIEKDTLAAIHEHCDDLTKASKPRLMEEIGRFFAFGAGEASMRLLEKTGLLQHLLPCVWDYLSQANDRQRARYYKFLKLLDAYQLERGEVHLALTFSTLLYPIWRDGRKPPKALREPSCDLRELVRRLNETVSFPRKLRESVFNLMFAQAPLEGNKGKRFRRRKFVARSFFAIALQLYRMAVMVEKIETEELAAWERSLEELQETRRRNKEEAAEKSEDNNEQDAVEKESSSTSGRNRRSRRRRGGRRRNGRDKSDGAEQSAEEVVAEQEPVAAAAVEVEETAPAKDAQENNESKKSSRRRRGSKRRKSNESADASQDNSAAEDNAAPAVNPYEMKDVAVAEAVAEEPKLNKNEKSRKSQRRRGRSYSAIRHYGRDDTPIRHEKSIGEQAPHWLDEI
jgi:poly(A) polymerase